MECFIPSAIAIKSPLERDFEWSLIHLLCVYCFGNLEIYQESMRFQAISLLKRGPKVMKLMVLPFKFNVNYSD